MGSVAMKKIQYSAKSNGYPIIDIVYCIYCDKCGSFNIRKRIPTIIAFYISSLFTAIMLLLTISFSRHDFLTAVVPGALTAFFGFLTFILGWKYSALRRKCEECGGVTTTDDNILRYQEYDMSLLDIPYEATAKYARDDYWL